MSHKITVVGLGYVGMSMSVLLSKDHDVIAFDIDKKKVDDLNKGVSPIEDKDIDKAINEGVNIFATTDPKIAFNECNYAIIATPTDYDPDKNFFNTKSIESSIKEIISINRSVNIVIKSTIPIGYTESIKNIFNYKNIYFSPEFLREGKALFDNLYPSRIIVGNEDEHSREFSSILKKASKKSDIPALFMNSNEAEAVKLFANTYLAMRVAFFNELDSFCISKKLNAKSIIQGVSFDSRIGDFYNNPSFGYGGYCLPKDTKQMLANFEDIPNSLISAVVRSNETRQQYLVSQIRDLNPSVIGIHRLIMKAGSDNFRSSAIGNLMDLLKDEYQIIIYEPSIYKEEHHGFEVINDLEEFKNKSNLILSNRLSEALDDVSFKVFTRDVFGTDS